VVSSARLASQRVGELLGSKKAGMDLHGIEPAFSLTMDAGIAGGCVQCSVAGTWWCRDYLGPGVGNK